MLCQAHSRDLAIVNVRAVAFRYDRFTSIPAGRFAQKPDIPRRRDDVSNRLVATLGARLWVSKLESSQQSWRRTSSGV